MYSIPHTGTSWLFLPLFQNRLPGQKMESLQMKKMSQCICRTQSSLLMSASKLPFITSNFLSKRPDYHLFYGLYTLLGYRFFGGTFCEQLVSHANCYVPNCDPVSLIAQKHTCSFNLVYLLLHMS